MRALIIALFTTFLLCGQSFAATVLYYTSTPGSWVGGGETAMVTPTTGYGFNFSVSNNFDNGVSFSINDFGLNPNVQNTRSWFLDFAAPNNATITSGLYLGATRFPFQNASEPGLTFAGNGRGNNMQTGYFSVHEIKFDLAGAVIAFAADFLQYDEQQVVDYTWGSIRFNSNVPVSLAPILNPVAEVPLPPAIALFGAGVAALGFARRRQRA